MALDAKRGLTICVIGSSQSVHTINRARCFAKRGHRVLLVCENASDITDFIAIVPQEELSRRFVLLRWLNALSLRLLRRRLPALTTLSLLALPALLRRYQPDIIHVHYAYSIWAWMAAVYQRCPLVVSLMGGDILFEEQGTPTPTGVALTLDLLKRADLITVKSGFLASELNKLGDFSAKTIRVVWGIDQKHFRKTEASSLRQMLGLPATARALFNPKALQPFYNAHLLVEALPAILAAFPDVVLLLADYLADTDYKRSLAQRIEELRLTKHVRFCPAISHTEMPRYYSLAEIVIGVPPSDGLPQALLEALACGTPNLLSRLPRYEEFVSHKESAYFVDFNPSDIAAGVIRLLGDAELRECISANGLRIVRALADFEQEVSRVETEYYRLLERPPLQTIWRSRMQTRLRVLRFFLS